MSTSEIVVEVWLEVLSPLTCEAEPATHTKLEGTLDVNARPTAVPEQIVSDDAEVIEGTALLVRTTSSKTEQGPSDTVHLNVAEVPAGTPETAEVGDDVIATVAVPEITVHAPTPGEGAFADRVNDPLPHCV